MTIDLEQRNRIAQRIIDMNVGDKLPIKKHDLIPIIKEVNNTAIIGHAVLIYGEDKPGEAQVKKYRKTAIEKRVEAESLKDSEQTF